MEREKKEERGKERKRYSFHGGIGSESEGENGSFSASKVKKTLEPDSPLAIQSTQGI